MSSIVGSVYFQKDFKFADGDSSDKLFVVINDPCDKYYQNYLVVLTTSQEKAGRKKVSGCGLPSTPSYFFPLKTDAFNLDTWIVFDEVYEITQLSLMQQTLSKESVLTFKMKDENVRALLNCLLKSEDISFERYDALKKVQNKLKEEFNSTRK